MECQNKNRRKSLRLKNFNYSNAGAYFVTICSQDMRCVFGDVIDGEMVLNLAGEMVFESWETLVSVREHLSKDEYIIMPNHFHGIIWIFENNVGVDPCINPIQTSNNGAGQIRRSAPTNAALFEIVQRFKSLTTNKYIKAVKNSTFPPFNKRIWQRNYYERIIRNETELNNTRQYILNNPKNWKDDEYCL